MLYFANPAGADCLDAMRAGRLGFIDTPKQGNKMPEGVTWCADNGCFGRGYPGDTGYLAWLANHRAERQLCAFATAPDVVGDAKATMERSMPFMDPIRERGYKAALVAQDGLEKLTIPWDDFDCLFIGGSTEWKLGYEARRIIEQAMDRSKWVHMGRVNSRKRIRYAYVAGCDSVDGTFLTFGPDKNLPPLLRWLDELPNRQPVAA